MSCVLFVVLRLGLTCALLFMESQELLEGDIYDPDVTPPALPLNLETNVASPSNDWAALPSSGHTNLNSHPHFRAEFELPYTEFYALMAERRIPRTADDASAREESELLDESEEEKPLANAASSRSRSHSNVAGPSASAVPPKTKKTHMEGLLGGDSDSSELTQPEDDEESTYSARRSVMTNKDDDDDDELNIPSGPIPSACISFVNVILLSEASGSSRRETQARTNLG